MKKENHEVTMSDECKKMLNNKPSLWCGVGVIKKEKPGCAYAPPGLVDKFNLLCSARNFRTQP